MRLMTLTRTVTLASAAALAVAASPSAAVAQTPPPVAAPPVTEPMPSQSPMAPGGAYWEVIAGLEFDTDGTIFGFAGPQWTRPFNDNVALTARAYANWLQYEFEESGGTTKVSGPGVSTQVGFRFGGRNWLRVGAGPSVTWRNETFTNAAGAEIEGDSDMDIGLSVGADAYLNPTDRDNIHALVNYETTDDYLWSRLGYKHQISNYDWQGTWAHFLGAEGIWQGNDDIRTLMFGGLVEFVHAPASTAITLRAGYKRSSFDATEDRTGPYFGINFYKRLGS